MEIWVGYTDETEEVIMEVYGLIEPPSFPFPYYGFVTEADPRYKVWYDIQSAYSPPIDLSFLPEPTAP